jgi:sec-independent protein translocase protein TatA
MPSLFAFLDPSPSTLLILGVIAILLFGERLPEVARSVGKGFMEFKKGVRNIQDDLEGAINSATSIETHSRYEEPADREEATAPKFEPPPSVSGDTPSSYNVPAERVEATAPKFEPAPSP